MISFRKKAFIKIPLQIALTAPFLVIITLAVWTTGHLSFQNGRQAIQDLSHQLQDEISSRIARHVATLLETPQHINEINADILQKGMIDVETPRVLEHYFWKQVQNISSITSIYFGNTQGELVDAGREGANGELYVMSTEGATDGGLKKYATDRFGNRTELLATIPGFDARTRPWYTAAVEKRDAVWSDIYLLSTGQGMAVAASRPVYDHQRNFLGVVSVDLFISHIDNFLQRLKIGKTGVGFIMDRSGFLVASSIGENPFTEPVQGEPKRCRRIIESASILIQHAANALEKRFGGYHAITETDHFDYYIDGQRYFLKITPLNSKYGPDWLSVVVLSEADFMGRINAGNRMTTFLIMAALSIAVLVGMIVSRRVSRPIAGLNASTKKLADGNWKQSIAESCWISEPGELMDSFNRMAARLRETIESLSTEITERKTAEKALTESKERLDLVLEGAGLGTWDWNVQTGDVVFNDRWAEILGYALSDIEPKVRTWEKLLHPEDSPAVTSALGDHLAGRTPVYSTEHRMLTNSGEWKWILDIGKVFLRDGEGAPVRAAGVHMDISDKKSFELMVRAERDMAEAWSRAGTFQQRLTVGLEAAIRVSSMDSGGFYLIDENDGSLTLVVQQGLSDTFVEKSRFFSSDSSNAQLVRNGTPIFSIYREFAPQERDLIAREGLKSVSVIPIIFEGRAVACLNLASHTIDHIDDNSRIALEAIASYLGSFVVQEMLEERNRQNRNDLETLFNTIQDMLFVLDLSGNIVAVNSSVGKSLGYDAEELTGRHVLYLHPEDHRQEATNVITKMIAKETEFCNIPLVSKTGRLIPVETKVVPGHWKGRDVIYGISRDVSERLRIEQQEQQIVKAESLNRMAAAIAHNFNNMLAVVMGNLELVLSDLPKEKEAFRFVSEAYRASERSLNITRSMLTYLGQKNVKHGLFNLTEACQKILPQFRNRMKDGIALEVDLVKPGPYINGNASQVQTAVLNLLDNAFESLGNGHGFIRLASEITPSSHVHSTHRFPVDRQPVEGVSYACIEVTDNGCGISETNIEKIFDPFFSTKFTGRGLGLSMALGIAREHGGFIALENVPGRGTVFRMYLPTSGKTE